MKSVTKVMDINAHIENLECQIKSDNHTALISFDNMGFGTITAIKFNAVGYNSFDDIVKIKDKEKFFLIIQDIAIKKNESAKNLIVKLPESDIRKIVLEECQICYEDGSITSYMGSDEREIELEAYEDSEEESKIFRAYQSKLGDLFQYKMKEYDFGWICSCGRLNLLDQDVCSLCNNSKEHMKEVTAKDQLTEVLEEYEQKKEEVRLEQEQADKQKEKERKKRRRKIIIASIIALIFFALIRSCVVLNGRTIYSSEEEMKSDLQGTWTYYSDSSGAGLWQVIIDGDTIGKIYDEGDTPSYLGDIIWKPSTGTFIANSTVYEVKKNGDIKCDDYIYRKGGSITSLASNRRETAETALYISNVYVTHNSSYTVCTGTITNRGKKSYDFIEVKGAFTSSYGTVLDTDWTYAVGSEGLDPGESKTFRMSVTRNSSITDCSVTLLD